MNEKQKHTPGPWRVDPSAALTRDPTAKTETIEDSRRLREATARSRIWWDALNGLDAEPDEYEGEPCAKWGIAPTTEKPLYSHPRGTS